MYQELYNAWKSEKNSPLPQPLSDDFYHRASTYLNGLEQDSTSSDPHTIQGRLLTREAEIARRLLEELRETRLRKILENAKKGILVDRETLTEEEIVLTKNLNDSLTTYKEEQKSSPSPEAKRAELAVVRFLQDIPEIVGVDLKIYGPYKKEDVGSLPAQNAQALVRQGAAKAIEVKGVSRSTENDPINNK
jgi:DNA replication initiation complex subunit (GINS family)